ASRSGESGARSRVCDRAWLVSVASGVRPLRRGRRLVFIGLPVRIEAGGSLRRRASRRTGYGRGRASSADVADGVFELGGSRARSALGRPSGLLLLLRAACGGRDRPEALTVFPVLAAASLGLPPPPQSPARGGGRSGGAQGNVCPPAAAPPRSGPRREHVSGRAADGQRQQRRGRERGDSPVRQRWSGQQQHGRSAEAARESAGDEMPEPAQFICVETPAMPARPAKTYPGSVTLINGCDYYADWIERSLVNFESVVVVGVHDGEGVCRSRNVFIFIRGRSNGSHRKNAGLKSGALAYSSAGYNIGHFDA
ncbi:MAG: hypothetical protein BJ554DRAFT_7785, partial [Olpidium bornovanus]